MNIHTHRQSSRCIFHIIHHTSFCRRQLQCFLVWFCRRLHYYGRMHGIYGLHISCVRIEIIIIIASLKSQCSFIGSFIRNFCCKVKIIVIVSQVGMRQSFRITIKLLIWIPRSFRQRNAGLGRTFYRLWNHILPVIQITIYLYRFLCNVIDMHIFPMHGESIFSCIEMNFKRIVIVYTGSSVCHFRSDSFCLIGLKRYILRVR